MGFIFDSLQSPEQVREITSSSRQWSALFVLGGEWCKWCVALKDAMAVDTSLMDAIHSDGLIPAVLVVDRKADDLSGTREKYGIKSIPFLALLDPDGKLIASTEFIGEDTPDLPGYIRWIRANNDTAL